MDRATKLIESLPKCKDEKHQKLTVQVASIVVASSLIYASYRILAGGGDKKKQGEKQIPVPSPCYPFVGHMLSLGKLPGKTISKWHAELGPILKLKMGAQTWVMVDEPALIHKIFVEKGAETSYRAESIYAFKQYSMGGK